MGNKLKDIELRSEEVQEILTNVPHWMIRWGNLLFLSLVILLLAISWFVKYPDVIQSEALITTQTPPQREYAKITGKIDAILVENNEQVGVNQPLAIIENTANHHDVFTLKAIVDTIRINNKYFSFPMDSLPVLFLGDIESHYALFENSYIQYQLNRELEPFSNEVSANTYAISELHRRLKSLQSQKEIYTTELDFINKDLARNQTLYEKGIISAQEYENKQLAYAQAKRNFEDFEASISQIREAISNAQKTARGTEIDRVKEEMTLLKNVIQSFNQLKKAIRDWENQYVLQSRVNGRVSFLNYWNVNQTVNQGDLVFTIVSYDNSSFMARLKTPPENSGKIKIGQKVNIKLENYPDAEFGVLTGSIKSISLIPDNEGFYHIDVKLPVELVTSYDKKLDFRQEMTGVAEIITEDLRLIERFFYQLSQVLQR